MHLSSVLVLLQRKRATARPFFFSYVAQSGVPSMDPTPSHLHNRHPAELFRWSDIPVYIMLENCSFAFSVLYFANLLLVHFVKHFSLLALLLCSSTQLHTVLLSKGLVTGLSILKLRTFSPFVSPKGWESIRCMKISNRDHLTNSPPSC